MGRTGHAEEGAGPSIHPSGRQEAAGRYALRTLSHRWKAGSSATKDSLRCPRPSRVARLLSLVPLGVALAGPSLFAQQSLVPFNFSKYDLSASLQQPNTPANPPSEQPGPSSPASGQQQTEKKDDTGKPAPQPKRILGVMPNFRAVSAGEVPPPPTARQAFIIATRNSFDYSSFIFVGITSLLAEATNTHAQLGKGVPGFGRYYWRGFVDKTDGNYLVIFALPTVFHQDERYYALGQGSILKRAFYAASRVAMTPDYSGHNSFNASELLGRGIAQGVSLAHYPSKTRTFDAIASKYAFAIGRDALTNTFREFWPDIATRVLHRHP